MGSTSWSPEQYERFADHRLRPALELLARIRLDSPECVFDLGCGTGAVTRLIAERWPSARVCGIDSSAEMLREARAAAASVRWEKADVAGWAPDEPPDLIYSNACLHWVADHDALFPRLAGSLREGGCLAVQMPQSWAAPSHRLMRETLADGGGRGRPFGTEALRRAVGRKWVDDAAHYYALLAGCADGLDIWETEYLQVLEGEDPALEWVKGTGLRPVLDGLAGEERDAFLAEYRRRLREAYPARPDGKTLYPFRRLFIVARARGDGATR